MSRNNQDEVNQIAAGRTSTLTFRSYQQSQGGAYECRVAGPGNNTESLSVCIGECYTLGEYSLLCTLQFINKSPPNQQIYIATS